MTQTMQTLVVAQDAAGAEAQGYLTINVNEPAAPAMTAQPSAASSSVTAGQQVTITAGTASGAPAPTLTWTLTLDGVDVSGDASHDGETLTYTPGAAGALEYQETWTNSVDAVQSGVVSVTVGEAVAGEAPGVYSDDFGDAELAERWTFTANDQSGGANPPTATVSGGVLTITIPDGTDYDYYNGVTTGPRVMQPHPDGDLDLRVKLATLPTVKYQGAGILIANADLTKWIRIENYSAGSGQTYYVGSTENGVTTAHYNVGVTAVYAGALRISRRGDEWTVWRSQSGGSWSSVATFTFAMEVTQVGPQAWAKDGAPGFTAAFEWFEDYVRDPRNFLAGTGTEHIATDATELAAAISAASAGDIISVSGVISNFTGSHSLPARARLLGITSDAEIQITDADTNSSATFTSGGDGLTIDGVRISVPSALSAETPGQLTPPAAFHSGNNHDEGVHYISKKVLYVSHDELLVRNTIFLDYVNHFVEVSNSDWSRFHNSMFQGGHWSIYINGVCDDVRFSKCWFLWTNGEAIKTVMSEGPPSRGPHRMVWEDIRAFQPARDLLDMTGGCRYGRFRGYNWLFRTSIDFKNIWNTEAQVLDDGSQDASNRDIVNEGIIHVVDTRTPMGVVALDKSNIGFSANPADQKYWSDWVPRNINFGTVILEDSGNGVVDWATNGAPRIALVRSGDYLLWENVIFRNLDAYAGGGPRVTEDYDAGDASDEDAPAGWVPESPPVVLAHSYEPSTPGLAFPPYVQGPATAPSNTAPVAVDDSYSVALGGSATEDPRENDTDADGNPLEITGATIQSGGGSVSFTTTSITVTADGAAAEGTPIVVEYTISDGQGGTDTGLATFAVTAAPITTFSVSNRSFASPSVPGGTTAITIEQRYQLDAGSGEHTVRQIDGSTQRLQFARRHTAGNMFGITRGASSGVILDWRTDKAVPGLPGVGTMTTMRYQLDVASGDITRMWIDGTEYVGQGMGTVSDQGNSAVDDVPIEFFPFANVVGTFEYSRAWLGTDASGAPWTALEPDGAGGITLINMSETTP